MGFVEYRRSERVADAVVHVFSIAFGLSGCISLVREAESGPDVSHGMALGLYAAGLLSMIGCSALYNLTSNVAWKGVFRRLDHAAIFVMIAGTYAPFALVAIRGCFGAALLTLVWAVALSGVMLKLLCPQRFERSSLPVYLLLGWTGMAAIHSLLATIPAVCLVLLGVGGAFYSLGVVFHLWARLRYHNAIWHGFVLSGAA
jgi:hemolysin III